ncbi:hypothetical protein LLG10_03870 [bacterium]|nr:hypothetical protein [bacterium]
MTSASWHSAFTHSWIGQLFRHVNRWGSHAWIFRMGETVWRFLQHTFLHSKLNAYFQSNQLCISRAIRQSYLIANVVLLIFKLMAWINRMMNLLFRGSLVEKLLKSIREDSQTNPVRYLASLFFSGFVIWAMLILLFGSGFSKPEVTVILLIAFLTWFLSLLDINTVQAFRNSCFIRWFCSWANSPEVTKKTQP